LGIKISAHGKRIPKKITLELICDADHGSEEVYEVFEQEGGYITQYAAAMKAGWKETRTDDGRQFVCPLCSGKVRK
jgi:hypothetical protein